MSVVEDYYKLKKFNVQEMLVTSETAATAATAEDGEGSETAAEKGGVGDKAAGGGSDEANDDEANDDEANDARIEQYINGKDREGEDLH